MLLQLRWRPTPNTPSKVPRGAETWYVSHSTFLYNWRSDCLIQIDAPWIWRLAAWSCWANFFLMNENSFKASSQQDLMASMNCLWTSDQNMVILGLLEIGDRGIHEGERTSFRHACLVSPSRMRSYWHLRVYEHVFRKATDTKGAKCLWPRTVQSTQRSSNLCFLFYLSFDGFFC